jgi:hypothetical protein
LNSGLRGLLEADSASWPSALTLRPALADALPAVVQAYREGLEPHQPATFERALLELSVVFPNNRAGTSELKARASAYSAALEDIPDDLVMKAVRLAIRQCEHFPKPAELRKLIEDDMIERRRKLHRAMLAARLPRAPDLRGDINRQSEVAAMSAGLANSWKAD